MKLHLPLLLRGVSVHVVHFYDLWDELDDLNQLLDLIRLNDIDNLLLEELGQSFINVSLDLGVFEEELLEFAREEVNEVLGPRILDRNFNGP
jgi:hypothetical protein